MKEVKIEKELTALQVPTAKSITFPAGQTLRMVQALGGTFTVMTPEGMTARVDGSDAEILGEDPPEYPDPDAGKVVEGDIQTSAWNMLKTVYDPEIPVNIVDLGLVYGVAKKEKNVEVDMTLTSPGCTMTEILKTEAERRIRSIPGVDDVLIQIVWDPPWDRSMMSDAARLELGMM